MNTLTLTIHLKTCYSIGTDPYKLPDGSYWDKLHLIAMLSNISRTCSKYSEVEESRNEPYEYSWRCKNSIDSILVKVCIDPNYVVDSNVNHWELDKIEFNGQQYSDYIYASIDFEEAISIFLVEA